MTAQSSVSVERIQGDLANPDRATAQTVERMTRHIHDAARDPLVIAIAKRAVAQYPLPNASPRSKAAWAAWWMVKHCTKFVQDSALFNRPITFVDGRSAFVNGRDELEMLVSPSVMARMKKPRGDCDDFVMTVLALLEVLGCPWEIVTVEANPNAPGEYSHVYGVAILEDGRRLPLDASHGWGPGWEVPAEHTVRYQAWDGMGSAVNRKREYQGLHGYRRRRRGMGDTAADVQEGGTYVPPASDNPTQDFGTFGGFDPYVSSGGSSNWSNFFQGLTTQGLNLVGKIVAPTSTLVRGPNGQLMISAPAGANINPFAAQLPSVGGGSSLLYIGGAALLLVLFMSMAKK